MEILTKPAWMLVISLLAPFLSFSQNDWDISTSGQIVYSEGDVGIGTNSPSNKLMVVSSTSGVISRFASAQNGGISGIRVQAKTNDGSDVRFLDIAYDAESDSYGFGSGTHSGVLPISSGFNQADIFVNTHGNLGIGTSSPDQKLVVDGHISTTKTYNTKFQFVRHGWSGSHGILFNSYYNPSVSGSLAATGNTYHANSKGNHSSGAGAIMFFSNGGTMDFRISEESPEIDQPIEWGPPKMRIRRNGYVGIGTSDPDAMLTVAGNIHSQEVKVTVDAGTGPDYVFEPTYNLRSLEETEAYIKTNKHLPEIPSAKEMEANGVQLGEMNMLLLKKIEELTLHLIEKEKELKAMKIDHIRAIDDLAKRIVKLENQ